MIIDIVGLMSTIFVTVICCYPYSLFQFLSFSISLLFLVFVRAFYVIQFSVFSQQIRYIYFFTLFYFLFFLSFFLFFLPFILSHVDDRLLVLQPGIRAVPLRWESQVQDTGPQEISQLHVISNGKNLPEISTSTSRPRSTQ